MSKEKWRDVLDTYNADGLQATFIEQLGWLAPPKPTLKLAVGDDIVTASVIAQLPGAAVIEVIEEGKPSSQWHKKVDSELKKHFSERLTRFSNAAGDSWYWPKKLASGAISYDRLETLHDRLPDFLSQRLAGLEFTPKDHGTPGKISPNEVRNRIRGQFESSKVTSDFFKKFKEKHEFLKSQIQGLPDDQTASSYSTLILNRLMFVYFLQKKEFLNSDANYLKNCLQRVQSLKGKDKFYSFYRHYLLELFFNRLDNSEGKVRDPAIAEILGDVPYVNGGVFSQHESEKNFSIEIPDQAFEQIFDFFDSYVWHLDTRPTGVANEINPEVIGYIFEQYINFTAAGKKENGAYYTTHDVTGFMVSQTLVPRILDEVVSLGVPVFERLQGNPMKYIHEALKHGQVNEKGDWKDAPRDLLDVWNGDPLGWGLLDAAPTDSELCLPDESWVEMFFRRERVNLLAADLAQGKPQTVNDLVTLNVSAQTLLVDSIDQIDSPKDVDTLWKKVTGLSVIDPTCGSGAFLFAALEVLEDVYAHIADRIAELSPKSVVVQEIASHPNLRYFLRKHASIRNLYGTDIMEDAIETAKLRIFLSLASCLESKDQIEPLPDLDFNLRVGNLLIGFKDAMDVARVDKGMVALNNPLTDIDDSLKKYVQLYENFLADSASNSESLASSKTALQTEHDAINGLVDSFFAECAGIASSGIQEWKTNTRPLHWIVEFPRIISQGGFDVVIGNPPYIARGSLSKQEVDSLSGYQCFDFRDIYLVCFERAHSLMEKNGRMSFIVPLSMSFGGTADRLRGLIARRKSAEWWSTYGLLPARLFSGAGIRNTILSLGVGETIQTTHHQIFSAASRSWLFQNLEFRESNRSASKPPVRAGVSQELGEYLEKLSEPAWREDGEEIFFRPTANYWVPALPKRPSIYSLAGEELGPDPRIQRAALSSVEDKDLAVAILGGKLGYFYWSSTGDDFDVNARELLQPRILVSRLTLDEKALKLARSVLDGITDATMRSNYAGNAYINIRWVSLRHLTDQFDKYVLTQLGLERHWRPLNIWYRQSMKSNDARVASGILSTQEALEVWS